MIDTSVTSDGPLATVTRLPGRLRMQLASPQRFNDARHIADCVKRGSPVLMDLRDADTHLNARLEDFAEGLAAALGGTVGRAGHRLLLVSPPGIQMTGSLDGDDAAA
jgi:FtsZ-interacting cell division protein YlmF